MSRIWTIARREVKALFDQPTGYVLLIVFLAINAFLYFRNAFLTGSASLRPASAAGTRTEASTGSVVAALKRRRTALMTAPCADGSGRGRAGRHSCPH